jgi:hypothetical protein
MKIERSYSHLNGYEHILVHKPRLWEEIVKVINGVDATASKRKRPRRRQKQGECFSARRQ